ncbi:MAG: hypothetical protein EZS28_010262 [Streblomastix strix]|uniref:Uncharacterized protein n=1 Tax=Streblomastix strix TaxID=222440 RepID=A0A5J4WHM8_9EUKA|nr:MAG: hypothetical protein EZS28_010262 [Streblomastix strix]
MHALIDKEILISLSDSDHDITQIQNSFLSIVLIADVQFDNKFDKFDESYKDGLVLFVGLKSVKNNNRFDHSLYENVRKDDISCCGRYISIKAISDALAPQTAVPYSMPVNFTTSIPLDDLLIFSAFSEYPNFLLGDLKIKFKINPHAFVFAQVNPTINNDKKNELPFFSIYGASLSEIIPAVFSAKTGKIQNSLELTHFDTENKLSIPIPSEIIQNNQTKVQDTLYNQTFQQYKQQIQDLQEKKNQFDKSEQEKSALCILGGMITVEVCKEINYSRRSPRGITPQMFMDLSNNTNNLHITKDKCDIIVAHVQSIIQDILETLNLYRSNAQIQGMIESKAHLLMQKIHQEKELKKNNNLRENDDYEIESIKFQQEQGIREIERIDKEYWSFIIDSIPSSRQPVLTWIKNNPDYIDDLYLFDEETNDEEEPKQNKRPVNVFD